jgi:hypothetical protein
VSAAHTAHSYARARQLDDVRSLAEFLRVEPSWVYANANRLGAIRLGAGPKPRLRFDRDRALELLNGCSASRESGGAETASQRASRPRRQRGSGTNVDLLPIRGQRHPSERAA